MDITFDPKSKMLTIKLPLKGAPVKRTRSGKGGYISFSRSEDIAVIAAPDGRKYRLRIPSVNLFLLPVEEPKREESRDAMFEL